MTIKQLEELKLLHRGRIAQIDEIISLHNIIKLLQDVCVETEKNPNNSAEFKKLYIANTHGRINKIRQDIKSKEGHLVIS